MGVMTDLNPGSSFTTCKSKLQHVQESTVARTRNLGIHDPFGRQGYVDSTSINNANEVSKYSHDTSDNDLARVLGSGDIGQLSVWTTLHGSKSLNANTTFGIPLIYLTKRGDGRMVKALVSHGANIDCPDSDGHTSLYWAINIGNASMVALLCSLGANRLKCVFDAILMGNRAIIDILTADQKAGTKLSDNRGAGRPTKRATMYDFLSPMPLDSTFSSKNSADKQNKRFSLHQVETPDFPPIHTSMLPPYQFKECNNAKSSEEDRLHKQITVSQSTPQEIVLRHQTLLHDDVQLQRQSNICEAYLGGNVIPRSRSSRFSTPRKIRDRRSMPALMFDPALNSVSTPTSPTYLPLHNHSKAIESGSITHLDSSFRTSRSAPRRFFSYESLPSGETSNLLSYASIGHNNCIHNIRGSNSISRVPNFNLQHSARNTHSSTGHSSVAGPEISMESLTSMINQEQKHGIRPASYMMGLSDVMSSFNMDDESELKFPNSSAFKVDSGKRICSGCGTTDTPQWRRNGNHPLCNACGLKQAHFKNRDAKNARRREHYKQKKVNALPKIDSYQDINIV
eukprot:CFRG3062T1